MRSVTVLSALLAVGALAACGGGAKDGGSSGAAQQLPRGLAPAVTLRKAYTVGADEKTVDAGAVPGSVLDPWRNPVVPVPKGSRLVAVQMTWLDRGPDRFPLEWARFTGRDDRGAQIPGNYVGPTRSSDNLRIVPVGFILRRGRTLESVDMRSIATAVWPFRATWKLRR